MSQYIARRNKASKPDYKTAERKFFDLEAAKNYIKGNGTVTIKYKNGNSKVVVELPEPEKKN